MVARSSVFVFCNSTEAGTPRCGFIRMSSGPSSFTEKPRVGSSICIEEMPRSAKIMSTPSRPKPDSTCGSPA